MGGDGDAVAGLQQAVSGYWAPPAAPINPYLAGGNSFLSPTTNIQDDHGLSFGLGDVTLGDKTSANGDGAVIQTSGHGATASSASTTSTVDNSTHVTGASSIDT